MHWHGCTLVRLPLQRRRQRRQLLHLGVVPGVEQRPDVSVAAAVGAQEAELGRLADDETELARRELDLGTFFEAVRHHAERFDRRTHAGNRGHGGFDAEIERARDAAANAYTAPAPR